MKILLIHNHYRQRSGEDVVFAQEREMLQAHGHEVITYSQSNDDIQQKGMLSQVRLLTNAIWSTHSFHEAARLLDAAAPDVVHVHNTFPRISPSVYSACKHSGIPVIQTLHNFRMFCAAGTFSRGGEVCEDCIGKVPWPAIAHACYRKSRTATAASALIHATHRGLNTWNRMITRFIVLTEFSRAKFVAAGIPLAKMRVKPNFVCPDPGVSDQDRSYALFVGRLFPEKGARTLLQAWRHLPAEIPLFVAGDGPELDALRSDAASAQLSGVRFLGRLARDEIVQWMRGARFLVLASSWYEQFPMVIAEAFATGTPVICPALGAMQELVAPGRTGLHYPCGGAAQLAETVRWAWSHRSEMRSMGRGARKEFEARYTAAHNHALLIDIYQDAIREYKEAVRRPAAISPSLDSWVHISK